MELIKWKRGGQWIENDEGYHYRYCGACGSKLSTIGMAVSIATIVSFATVATLRKQQPLANIL